MAEAVPDAPAPPPPFFLRECSGNFPFSAILVDERHEHRRRGEKAFELAVSMEVLLKTTNAAELLLEFLNSGPLRDIVMLHDDLYISKFGDHRRSIYQIQMNTAGGTTMKLFIICRRPNSTTTAVDVIDSGVMMDPVLLLLAKHKSIRYISIDSMLNNSNSFPSSLAALNYFVSKAESPRKVCLNYAGLSATQWQVVTFSCNQNVDFSCVLGSFMPDGMLQALMEAINCNVCPAKLDLHLVRGESHDFDLLVALGSITSLTKLRVHIVSCEDATIFVMLMEAVLRNRGLQHLEIVNRIGFDLTDDQWERICCTITSHPSIKTFACSGFWTLSPHSETRDELFIQHVKKNTVLCELDVSTSFSYNWHHVNQAVRPTLEMNRIRPVLDAIKHEREVARRRSLLAATLQSNQVFKRPAYRFLLLKHNVDLLVDGMVLGKKRQGCEHAASFSSSSSIA